MCGIALPAEGGGGGDPLGFVQLAIYPMQDKDSLHTTKPGETYIEQITVAAAARGKGVGRALLQWAEDRAREKQCNVLTLAVLNGNKAKRLYERVGFVDVPTDACDQLVGGFIVCFLMGRPYGLCDPHCGSVDMRKALQ